MCLQEVFLVGLNTLDHLASQPTTLALFGRRQYSHSLQPQETLEFQIVGELSGVVNLRIHNVVGPLHFIHEPLG